MAPSPVATGGTDRSPLEECENAFMWLVTGPAPLSLVGRQFDGLPSGRIPLNVVRARLMSARVPADAVAQVWAHLVARARIETDRTAGHGSTWTVACAGMAVPDMARVAARLSLRYPGHAADVEAAVLSGFLDELRRIDVLNPRLLPTLRAAGLRSGTTFVTTLTAARAENGGTR